MNNLSPILLRESHASAMKLRAGLQSRFSLLRIRHLFVKRYHSSISGRIAYRAGVFMERIVIFLRRFVFTQAYANRFQIRKGA